MGVHVIRLPDVGEGIAEAEIAEWLVKVGDQVREDQPLGSVMTDKATVEIPSPRDGTVAWLGGEVGDVLAVGSEFVKLEVAGEGAAATERSTEALTATTEPAAKTPAPKLAPTPSPATSSAPPPAKSATAVPPPAGLPRPEGEKPIAAPAVRQRARNLGIDLAYVHGSGPAGRITHEDLELYASGARAPRMRTASLLSPNTEVEETKITGLRRKIAERMQIAKQHIPHITYVEEVDVTELESLRQHLNTDAPAGRPRMTLLPFLIRALVKALKDFPAMNARFDDDTGVVRRYGGAHIGVATQTPTGLVVPVVRHAEARDLWDCAYELQRLAETARAGKASRDELGGSTITITSLGALGGIVTTPVINYPEVAIVGVNKISLRPVYRDGLLVPRKIMNLSSSFDHRLIDGWDAAAFVQRLKGLLEHPATILTEGA
jgi:2-oxoisovalerate dehydrogenase E2 component (dihydrolipoyl transacylase)